MKLKVKHLVVALLALLPAVGIVACSSLKPAVEQTIKATTQVSAEADGVIKNVQATIDSLPVSDPQRAVLQKSLDQAKAVKAQADKYVASASAILASLDSATIDPEAGKLIGTLPYGAYVLAGISLFGYIKQRGAASSVLADLTNVVHSWEAVGADLTAEQKKAVASIQGASTSATVDAIKDTLAAAGKIVLPPAPTSPPQV